MSRSTQSAPEIQMTNCRINNPKFSPVIKAWNIYFWKNLFVVFILYIIFATASWKIVYRSMQYTEIVGPKVIMQGKLFQRFMHLLYCSLLSLGGNVNARWMSKPYMGSIFHIKNQRNILVIGSWCIYSCLQIPSRENWFSICTQRIRNCN